MITPGPADFGGASARPYILLNLGLAICGMLGLTWYLDSGSSFFPALFYFVLLGSVGSVTALAGYLCTRSSLMAGIACAGLGIAMLLGLQITAFAVSPGSGAAVIPLIGGPAAIQLASLNWFKSRLAETE